MVERPARGSTRRAHFFNAASQFTATVIGAEFSSSALMLTRKRWPSRADHRAGRREVRGGFLVDEAAVAGARIGSGICRKHLDGDGAIEPGVSRLVDNAHAARSDQRGQEVRADL